MEESTHRTGIPATPRHDTFFSFLFFFLSIIGTRLNRPTRLYFCISIYPQRTATEHTHATSGAQSSRSISCYLVDFSFFASKPDTKGSQHIPFYFFSHFSCGTSLTLTPARGWGALLCWRSLHSWQIFLAIPPKDGF
jgi:hypothetical protein